MKRKIKIQEKIVMIIQEIAQIRKQLNKKSAVKTENLLVNRLLK